CRPVRWFSAYYSAVLGREISMRQTLHLLNAQLAFVFVVLPADISFVARAVCCGWLLKAVMACRKSL
ncbi:MAG: ATP-binding protein, partial [Segatella salivae]